MLVKSKEIRNHVKDLEETFAVLNKVDTERAPLPLHILNVPGRQLYVGTREDGTQTPIYYVSKVLNGAECRYPSIEKMALALVITARKLRPYFISYPIGVRINTPLKHENGPGRWCLAPPGLFSQLIVKQVSREYQAKERKHSTILGLAISTRTQKIHPKPAPHGAGLGRYFPGSGRVWSRF
ncbi:UNVERIFIED_CONTAM: hypothetical protein Scaly_3076900 [Sesamum calycinum]|uniref:Reverse transcriptase RNase H-like domain-containing protein n=1 Tax=Sesamum calycinum TaxID=2727403 RepID=A0AAW2JTL7_9LAMI